MIRKKKKNARVKIKKEMFAQFNRGRRGRHRHMHRRETVRAARIVSLHAFVLGTDAEERLNESSLRILKESLKGSLNERFRTELFIKTECE